MNVYIRSISPVIFTCKSVCCPKWSSGGQQVSVRKEPAAFDRAHSHFRWYVGSILIGSDTLEVPPTPSFGCQPHVIRSTLGAGTTRFKLHFRYNLSVLHIHSLTRRREPQSFTWTPCFSTKPSVPVWPIKNWHSTFIRFWPSMTVSIARELARLRFVHERCTLLGFATSFHSPLIHAVLIHEVKLSTIRGQLSHFKWVHFSLSPIDSITITVKRHILRTESINWIPSVCLTCNTRKLMIKVIKDKRWNNN